METTGTYPAQQESKVETIGPAGFWFFGRRYIETDDKKELRIAEETAGGDGEE